MATVTWYADYRKVLLPANLPDGSYDSHPFRFKEKWYAFRGTSDNVAAIYDLYSGAIVWSGTYLVLSSSQPIVSGDYVYFAYCEGELIKLSRFDSSWNETILATTSIHPGTLHSCGFDYDVANGIIYYGYLLLTSGGVFTIRKFTISTGVDASVGADGAGAYINFAGLAFVGGYIYYGIDTGTRQAIRKMQISNGSSYAHVSSITTSYYVGQRGFFTEVTAPDRYLKYIPDSKSWDLSTSGDPAGLIITKMESYPFYAISWEQEGAAHNVCFLELSTGGTVTYRETISVPNSAVDYLYPMLSDVSHSNQSEIGPKFFPLGGSANTLEFNLLRGDWT